MLINSVKHENFHHITRHRTDTSWLLNIENIAIEV